MIHLLTTVVSAINTAVSFIQKVAEWRFDDSKRRPPKHKKSCSVDKRYTHKTS